MDKENKKRCACSILLKTVLEDNKKQDINPAFTGMTPNLSN